MILGRFNMSKGAKINDLIFKELLKRGYSLRGNTRVWNIADSKLWYLTPEQAQAYLDLEDAENFKQEASNSEFELLSKNMSVIEASFGKGPVNIIDLGCGDGKKAAYVIEKLKDGHKIKYCPIDISSYMVKSAVETVNKMNVGEVVETQWNISDFENLENVIPLLIKGDFKKNLFLLLGHTLGNFDIHEILYEIRSSMKKNDIIVLVSGVASQKWEQWTHNVTSQGGVKMNDFFVHIPLQLGLSKNEIEFGARLHNSRVEYYYVINVNKTIKFQDKTIDFNKDDQIIVAVSYKHDKSNLNSLLGIYFSEVNLDISKDGSTALAVCKA